MREASIHDLPTEILMEIAYYTPFEDIWQLCDADHWYNKLFCENQEYWKRISIADFGDDVINMNVPEDFDWREFYAITYSHYKTEHKKDIICSMCHIKRLHGYRLEKECKGCDLVLLKDIKNSYIKSLLKTEGRLDFLGAAICVLGIIPSRDLWQHIFYTIAKNRYSPFEDKIVLWNCLLNRGMMPTTNTLNAILNLHYMDPSEMLKLVRQTYDHDNFTLNFDGVYLLTLDMFYMDNREEFEKYIRTEKFRRWILNENNARLFFNKLIDEEEGNPDCDLINSLLRVFDIKNAAIEYGYYETLRDMCPQEEDEGMFIEELPLDEIEQLATSSPFFEEFDIERKRRKID